MKKTIYLLLFVVMTQAVFSQKTLSVDEAVRIALQRNVTLMKTGENLKSTQTGVQTAYGALLPSVNGQVAWTWNKSTTIAGLYGPNSPSFQLDTRTYTAGVASNWTLFDGLANFANLSKNEKTFESAKFQFSKLKQDVVFQTLSSFYDVLDAQKLLAVKEEDLKWNQKNFEIISERNKLGAVTLADVYSQQVKTGNAELELIKAKNSYQTLKSAFQYYLGLDVLEEYSLQDPAPLDMTKADVGLQTENEQITNSINEALKSRDDYLSAKLSLQSAQESITIAKAGYLPSVTNQVSIGSQVDDVKNLFKTTNYSVGLSLNIPIFSGWSTSSQIQMAQVDTKVKEIELEDLSKQIKRDIQRNFLDLQSAYKAIDVSTQNVKAAEENRRIQQEKYSLGSTTLLDVLIANSDYTTAVTNLINSQYAYRKLKDEARYLLGKLDYKNFENKGAF